MKRIPSVLIILVGSFLGGLISEPAVGFFHRAYAQVVTLTQLAVNRSITWSGASGFANSWIWQSDPAAGAVPGSNPASGTCTDPNICVPNLFVVGRDTVDASAATNGFYAYNFVDNYGGAGAKGSHHTGLFSFNFVGAPSDTGQFYSSLNFWTTVTANAGGTSGATSGDFFGGNDQCLLGSGATFIHSCVGIESDISLRTGASADYLIGHQVVKDALSVVPANVVELAYSANNATGATGWDILFADGSHAGFPSLKTTGTWGGCYPHGGTGDCGTIKYGLDLTTYAAITGAPILAPLATPSSSSATCKQGAMEWDANFVYICTATNTFKRATLATF